MKFQLDSLEGSIKRLHEITNSFTINSESTEVLSKQVRVSNSFRPDLEPSKKTISIQIEQMELKLNESIQILEIISAKESQFIQYREKDGFDQKKAIKPEVVSKIENDQKSSIHSVKQNNSNVEEHIKRIDNEFQSTLRTDYNSIQEVTDFYNQAVLQINQREEFILNFQPEYFDTVNAKERQHNPDLKPVYSTSSNGVFMALKADERYFIFPRFGFSLKRINYNAGAVKDVFDCNNFNPDLTYSKIYVNVPALFTRDGDVWKLKNSGNLDIGQGG